MKLQKILLATALVVLSASCQNQIENPVDKSDASDVKLIPVTFNAQTEETKTTLDGLSIVWEEGDQINVIDNSILCEDYSAFDATSAGSTTGFSGLIGVDATIFYALYPYDATTQSTCCAEDDLAMFTTTLKTDQYARPSGLPANTNIAFAKADDQNAFTFHNLCAVVKFTLTRDDIAAIEIAPNGEEALAFAGSINVTLDADGADIERASTTSTKSLSIEPAEGDTFAPGTYYVCALPGSYDGGITVTFMNSDADEAEISSTAALTLIAGKIRNLGTIDKNLDFGGDNPSNKYVKVTKASDLTDGQYLIVCEDQSLAFNGALETLDAIGNSIAISIVNGEIASSTETDAAAFTFTASNGSFLGTGGKYFGNASNSNALTSSDTALTNTVSITGGDADIVSAGGSYLRYNATSGQTRFRYYKSSTYTSQKAIQLYKKNGTPVPPATKYTITVPDNLTGGTVTSDKYEAEAGETVTITASPESGYLISELTANVEGEVRNGRELSFSMPEADVTISASFVIDNSKVAVFTIDSATSVNKSGDCAGLSATFNNSYTSNKQQLTNGNTMTLTISGLGGKTITGLTLSMHSNKSAGAGYLSVLAGSSLIGSIGSSNSGVAFNDSAWNKAWSTDYVDINTEINEYTFQSGENLVITIGATVNSLFCESFTIKYTDSGESGDDVTLSSIAIKTAPTKVSYTAGEKFDPTGLVITKTMSDETTEDVAYAGNESDFTFEPSLSTALTTGDTSVTITYGGKTTTCDITVNAASVTEYASLADLIATEGAPTTSGKQVKVTLTEEIIKSIYVSKSSGNRIGVFVSVGDNDIELYHSDVPAEWVNGGTISGTVEGSWKLFNSTWEIEMTSDWTGIEYSAPAAVAVTGVSLDKTEAEVEVGKTVTLTATVAPANATNKNVTWSSSDEDIATVVDGVVSGVAAGTATITATTNDGGYEATCTVTVSEKPTTSAITITSNDIVSNSGYTTYSNDDWIITFGGNNKSVGTNSGNRSKCVLGSDYAKYAVSPIGTTDVASAFASLKSLSNISKVKCTFNGGSNQTNTNVYLLYSSDGNTFSQVSLKKGTQGASISSETVFEFDKCSGYFAVVFVATNTSGNWRIDNVELTFE